MAERYEEQYRRDHGYRDRGFVDRAGDDVRSWFGDEEAERRRQLDDRERGYQGNDRGYQGSGRGYGGPNPGYYDRGAYYRPVNRDSLGDRGNALSDSGYADRSYGGYTDRAFSQTYDRGPSVPRDYADRYGAGRHESWRDSPDPGYRSDAWQGMNYPTSQPYGNRDMPWSRDERNSRNFTGQGPRGYQRSDARINEDVCDCLCDTADVDARNIDVSVANGEVTLNGSVSDRDQKRRAEDLIEHVSGVREVHNNLKVAKGSEWSGSATNGQAGATGASGSVTGEQPGNVLGVGGGAPDRTSTAGRR